MPRCTIFHPSFVQLSQGAAIRSSQQKYFHGLKKTSQDPLNIFEQTLTALIKLGKKQNGKTWDGFPAKLLVNNTIYHAVCFQYGLKEKYTLLSELSSRIKKHFSESFHS